jgi:hypothetical protein
MARLTFSFIGSVSATTVFRLACVDGAANLIDGHDPSPQRSAVVTKKENARESLAPGLFQADGQGGGSSGGLHTRDRYPLVPRECSQ